MAGQRFDQSALQTTFNLYRSVLDARDGELAAVEAELMPCCRRDPVTGVVDRLACYRGIAELSALTLAAEVID